MPLVQHPAVTLAAMSTPALTVPIAVARLPVVAVSLVNRATQTEGSIDTSTRQIVAIGGVSSGTVNNVIHASAK